MPGEAAEPLSTPGPFAKGENDGADSAASLGSTKAAALSSPKEGDGTGSSTQLNPPAAVRPGARASWEGWGDGAAPL